MGAASSTRYERERDEPIFNPGYNAALTAASSTTGAPAAAAINYGPRLALPENMVTNSYSMSEFETAIRAGGSGGR